MRRARPGSAPDPHRLEYEQRVNRVIDHVRAHLGEALTLAGLARVAAFSPFHFDRVFKAIAGETLFGFVHRLRIEQAARGLLTHPERGVLEVALDHGFASAAAFARAFRARFAMTATQWRAGGHTRRDARGRQARRGGAWRDGERRAGRGGAPAARGRAPLARSGRGAPMRVEIRRLPPYRVAYMRHVGPYGARGIPSLWARLDRWMTARAVPAAGRITIGVGYDDPRITAADRCRYDACVVVPPDFAPDRWVNVTTLAGGACAVWPFAGTAHEIVGAWDRVFAAWLPESGWAPDDRPCVEVYRGRRASDPPERFRCELCLPVRPL